MHQLSACLQERSHQQQQQQQQAGGGQHRQPQQQPQQQQQGGGGQGRGAPHSNGPPAGASRPQPMAAKKGGGLGPTPHHVMNNGK
mmetsp:Transcript_9963/g.25707  ORF Transcript_9963/g.25707 Transcript_9963/m.25707 type:complete len:85 (-) Transcript_9963:837-1091(-)